MDGWPGADSRGADRSDGDRTGDAVAGPGPAVGIGMTSARTAILVADVLTGWFIGNALAMLLVVTHPVQMSFALVVRNVFVAGLAAGVLITLLITGARDAHRLGLLNHR